MGTITLLISGEYDGREVVSAHESDEDAARALGRMVLSPIGIRNGPWSLEHVEYDGPERGQQQQQQQQRDAGTVAAVAEVIRDELRFTRHETDGTPRGQMVAAAAQRVVNLLGRRSAGQAEQRGADLAAALGMDEVPDWPEMCRKVAGLRQAEDDYSTRVSTLRRRLLRELDPAKPGNLDGLEAAYLELAQVDDAEWANLDGRTQGAYVDQARQIVAAYLRGNGR